MPKIAVVGFANKCKKCGKKVQYNCIAGIGWVYTNKKGKLHVCKHRKAAKIIKPNVGQ